MINKKVTKLTPYSGVSYPFQIETTIELKNNTIKATYTISGEIAEIHIPKYNLKSTRTIGLWNDTCFELFIRESKGNKTYFEFNVSPNGNWNCFKFNYLGEELKEYKDVNDIDTKLKISEKKIILSFSAKLDFLGIEVNEYSTTAVIKFRNELSYWAPKHLDDKPNFHHQESYLKLK